MKIMKFIILMFPIDLQLAIYDLLLNVYLKELRSKEIGCLGEKIRK